MARYLEIKENRQKSGYFLQLQIQIQQINQMCFYHSKNRSSRIWMQLGKYQIFDCKFCRNQQKLKNLQLCGNFSVLYASLQEFNFHLQSKLIRLEEESNFIQCEKCKQKFHLKKKGNKIYVSTFICIHQKGKIMQCKYCRKLVKKKQYQRCKKCQLSLFFFDESRQVKCPNCNIVCCEHCKEENQLFQQQFCKCKIIKSTRNLVLFQCLCFLILGLVMLLFICSYYLEHSEFYQSIVCTIKDGYFNQDCTLEQFYKDTLKQFLLFSVLIFIITLISILIENIPYIIKLQHQTKRSIYQ
ncbi:unnamed protein product [Paramecium sonneborni]|uniref:Transmembrane protein n=1 Tax=Paramecium sonneborni TaxID=65129 RepID=A0A8S1RM52_9CILI|nr:unnamed protein product [Paramecium sonneborni]